MQQPLKFEVRLVVEHDRIKLVCLNAGMVQTEAHRMDGEGLVVLFSSEPFLLGSRSHLTVHNESRSSIVIVGGDAEDSHDIFRLVVATL